MHYKPHSGLGITSLIMSIFSGVLVFVVIVIAGIVEESTPGGMDENSPAALLIGLAGLGSMGLTLVALVLGVIGLLQSDRNKTLPMIGTILSLLVIVGTTGLVVLGMMMEG